MNLYGANWIPFAVSSTKKKKKKGILLLWQLDHTSKRKECKSVAQTSLQTSPAYKDASRTFEERLDSRA
jgi:hypothetical protein